MIVTSEALWLASRLRHYVKLYSSSNVSVRRERRNSTKLN